MSTCAGPDPAGAEPRDREALRRRYRVERDKRLRPDGDSQCLEPTGRFAHLLHDPYVARADREPVTEEVTVALIGGGFAGLVTGARLKQAGIDDLRIIEGGGDFGPPATTTTKASPRAGANGSTPAATPRTGGLLRVHRPMAQQRRL